MSPYITTHSGTRFSLAEPRFHLIDIAHGLSMKCRWSGQCNQFYSVAQHAVLVSEIMQKLDLGDPFEGLHHDDSEAYLPDMPTPWKRILPDFSAMEKKLEFDARCNFNLPAEITGGCKLADTVALIVEARSLFNEVPDWLSELPYTALNLAISWPNIEHCLSPMGARTSYLFAHEKLLRKRK